MGRACGLSQSGESKVLKRAREAVLSWPLPEGLDEAALQEPLFWQECAEQHPEGCGYSHF